MCVYTAILKLYIFMTTLLVYRRGGEVFKELLVLVVFFFVFLLNTIAMASFTAVTYQTARLKLGGDAKIAANCSVRYDSMSDFLDVPYAIVAITSVPDPSIPGNPSH